MSVKTATESRFGRAQRGSFGDPREEGFRITRWDGNGEPAGRHWFDAHSLVLCLNVAGRGKFQGAEEQPWTMEPGSMVIAAAPRRQNLERMGEERHRFVVLEMRRTWVSRWLAPGTNEVRTAVRKFIEAPRSGGPLCEVRPMTPQITQLASDVLQPPAAPAAWTCWHHAKALEMVSCALFVTEEAELFCERTKRVSRERVERVREILLADIENPPSLTELGRRVGCSPFYLSRIFRQETGITISACLRRARLERAAELLRGGGSNVTEAAMTVGYSSLSHFSKAFAEAFGCCPCLYGRKPQESAITRAAA